MLEPEHGADRRAREVERGLIEIEFEVGVDQVVSSEPSDVAIVGAYPEVIVEITHHPATQRIDRVVVIENLDLIELETAFQQADAGGEIGPDTAAVLAAYRDADD